MKLHDMDSFRRNRAVRGHVGCLVHSVHRILFMPGDNDFGVFRRDLRVYGLRTGTRQFQSRIVPITCSPFSRWISAPGKTVPAHPDCPWRYSPTTQN